MHNFKNIFSRKISRKKFFAFSALSAAAFYSLFKMPFGFLFNKKQEKGGNKSSVKVSLNPDAVSRNPGGNNA